MAQDTEKKSKKKHPYNLIFQNYHEKAKELLPNNVDPNIKPQDSKKISEIELLYNAFIQNNLAEAEKLLQNNIDPNKKISNDKGYLLDIMVIDDNIKAVELLLKYKAKPRYFFDDSHNILIDYFKKRTDEKTYSLIELMFKYLKDGFIKKSVFKVLINNAVKLNFPKTLELLLKKKNNLNGKLSFNEYAPIEFDYFKGEIEKSPFEYALGSNHFKIAEILLDHGSNPFLRVKGKPGTAYNGIENIALSHHLTDIQTKKYFELVEEKYPGLLVEKRKKSHADLSFINYLIGANFIKSLEYLLHLNLNPNTFHINSDVKTPLIYAIMRKRLEIVKLLLKYKADANVKPKYIISPIHYAVISDYNDFEKSSLIELLLEYGADIKEKDFSNETAVDKTMRRENINASKLLLDHGASLKVNNNLFRRPYYTSRVSDLIEYYKYKNEINFQEIKDYILKFDNPSDPSDLLKYLEFSSNKASYFKFIIKDLMEEVIIENNKSKSFSIQTWKILKDYLAFHNLKITDKNKINLNEILKILNESFLEDIIKTQKKCHTEDVNQMKVELKNECVVCLDPIIPEENQYFGMANCSCALCKECFENYWNYENKKNGKNISKCPGCSKEVNLNSLKNLPLEDNQIQKWYRNYLAKKLGEIPRWKFCPTPECLSGKLIDPKKNESFFFDCPICDTNYCFSCETDHKGSCETNKGVRNKIKLMLELGEFAPPKNGHPKIKYPDVENIHHRDYFLGRFRPCPECGVIIEKEYHSFHVFGEGECNNMECYRCKTNFNWNNGLDQGGGTWSLKESNFNPKIPSHY